MKEYTTPEAEIIRLDIYEVLCDVKIGTGSGDGNPEQYEDP